MDNNPPPQINYDSTAPPVMTMQPMAPGQLPPRSTNTRQWMERPAPFGGCPAGLEYLASVDQLLIQQEVELLEVMTDWETANKYKVLNSNNQQVYFAAEESDECSRQCCKDSRGFTMHLTDNQNQEVLRVIRPFKCCAGCCWCAGANCCATEVEVQAPVGQTVGYVKQIGTPWTIKYDILDENMKPVLRIVAPCCVCECCCCTDDIEFKVLELDEMTQVGRISKKWAGLVQELFTTADTFGISFRSDLDVKTKAILMGAVFLIDFDFFEHKDDDNN